MEAYLLSHFTLSLQPTNFFYYLLYLESGLLSVAYLTVANLARFGISVHC